MPVNLLKKMKQMWPDVKVLIDRLISDRQAKPDEPSVYPVHWAIFDDDDEDGVTATVYKSTNQEIADSLECVGITYIPVDEICPHHLVDQLNAKTEVEYERIISALKEVSTVVGTRVEVTPNEEDGGDVQVKGVGAVGVFLGLY